MKNLRAILLLPAALFVAAGSARADITPDEAEKKKEEERKLLPVLDRPGEKDPYENLAAEGEANLKEIQRLLDEIQENLAREETGASTQGKQAEVAEKMQSLLEKLEQACKKCSGGGGGQGQQSADQKQQKEEPSGKEEQQGQPRDPNKSQAQQPQQKDSEQENRRGQAENRRVEDQVPPEARAGNLRDQLLEMSRRWGLLPPKLREEMLFSTGREAPPEYLEIISRYYKRLTEFYQESSGR